MAAVEADVGEWGLDPTFWAYSKMFAVELLPPHLAPSQSIPGGFVHPRTAHPLLHVEVNGVVVSVVRRLQMVVYAVDDGTAVVDAVVWRQKDAATGDYASDDTGKWGLALGDLTTVQGRVGIYVDKDGDRHTQISAHHVQVHADPNAEACFWLHKIHLHRTAYASRQKDSHPGAIKRSGGAARHHQYRSAAAAAAAQAPAVGAVGAAAAPPAGLAKAGEYIAECGRPSVTDAELQAAVPGTPPAVMQALLKQLVRNGKIFPIAASETDGARQRFEVIAESCRPEIEAAIRDGCGTITAVHDHLRTQARFVNIPRSDVYAALDTLVAKNVVYKVRARSGMACDAGAARTLCGTAPWWDHSLQPLPAPRLLEVGKSQYAIVRPSWPGASSNSP